MKYSFNSIFLLTICMFFVGICFLSCIKQQDDDYLSRIDTIYVIKQSEARIGLNSMSFKAEGNPYQLVNDAKCVIKGDSVVECWIPNIMPNKQLVAHLDYIGDRCSIGGIDLVSDVTRCDYKQPMTLTVSSKDTVKNYRVYVHSFTGLPVMWIETENRNEITSKDEYIRGTFKLVEDVQTRSPGDVIFDSLNIKGRGNSTWGMPKKPYRLKFDKKIALLDESPDKSWVLLNNYADKTMLRNYIAFWFGERSNLGYTPKSHFVELMLNGRYNGTYLLCEKLKISKSRVNVGNDGFLLEIDAKSDADDVTFNTEHLSVPINIKEPELTFRDSNYIFITDFVRKAENVLFSHNFTDVKDGWRKYMDMDSFVDWYLINEIAKNNDACFFTSCYMNLKRESGGGKLKMGPLWDFDRGYGNVNYNGTYAVEGFWVNGASWYSRLFQDPVFVQKVKERFDYFYCLKYELMREINENFHYLKYAVLENENRWHTLYVYTTPNYDIWGNYENEVQSMKEWLSARLEWLKREFDKM